MGILRDLGTWFANLLGLKDLSFDVMYVGIGVLALAILLLVIIVAIIVKCVNKGKKGKADKPVKAAEPVIEKEVTEQSKPQEKVETVAENVETAQEQAVAVEEKVATEQAVAVEEKVEEKEVKPIVTPVAVEVKPAKKPAVKSTAKKVSEKKPEEKKEVKKQLNGKWLVEIKSVGEYMSKLLASNGEIMLSSEIYTTEEGARNGIASILRGVENGKFVIYQDKSKNYYYKLKTTTNRLLCVGEIYKSKDQCLKAVETVKRIAAASVITDGLVEGQKYAEYTPATLDTDKKGLRGKWKIEKTEQGNFTARLYANNGQLMLATEEVALEKSAKNAIESVKKNALDGNFIIDHDKFGRFYYKLRNAQKSVICIGEAYDKLDSCVSAIESVRRFAQNSVFVEE